MWRNFSTWQIFLHISPYLPCGDISPTDDLSYRKFLHMTICLVEKFSPHGKFFSTGTGMRGAPVFFFLFWWHYSWHTFFSDRISFFVQSYPIMVKDWVLFLFIKVAPMQEVNLYSSSEGNIEVNVIYCSDYHHEMEAGVFILNLFVLSRLFLQIIARKETLFNSFSTLNCPGIELLKKYWLDYFSWELLIKERVCYILENFSNMKREKQHMNHKPR